MMDIFSVKRRMNVGGPLWWSLDGVSDANVLGAWRFKGRNTKAAAVTDLTKNNRTLDGQGDCSWSQSSGITVSVENRNSVTARYLDNSTIRNNCKSAVLKISGINRLAGTPLTGGWGGISVWLNTPFATQSFWYDNSGKAGIAHGNGRSVNAGGSLARTAVQVATTGDYGSACTIGFTLDGETLYRDGVASSKAIATYVHPTGGDHGEWTMFASAGIPRLVGGVPPQYNDSASWDSAAHWWFVGSFTVAAMVFFDKKLEAADQQKIYKQMLFI